MCYFMQQKSIQLIDPSELLRPEFAEKDVFKFRDYSVDETDPLKERVRKTYRDMHLNQSVDFVKGLCVKGLIVRNKLKS